MGGTWSGVGQGTWGLEQMNDREKPVGQQKPMETPATRTKKSEAKPAKLGREVQARLGQQLRAMYDDVLNQGVPDRFADLIKQLDGNGSGNKDGQ
jgi:hypothetical protein